MSASNSHIVKSQEYLIELDDIKDAHKIQSEISLLQSTKIISIIDSILSKYDDPDHIQIFQKIELDLGKVNKQTFEEEILYKLEEALEGYMKLTVKEDGNSGEGSKITFGDRDVDHLEQFLINGHYKWNQTLTITTSALLQKIREENPISLAAMLRKVTKMENVRKRLSYQFNSEELDYVNRIITESKEESTNESPPSEINTELNKSDLQMTSESSPELFPSLFINNAGLIILGPYLGVLFERCSLTENGAFKNSKAEFQAIQLLDYAGTGATNSGEHELILPKILCGVPVQNPIDTSVAISEEQKVTVDSLLEAVTQQWSALNNTTIDSLRGSFLMRDGKLEEMEESIHLKVEQKAFDILLDQIPWNISTIKLSWMPKLLQVEWR